LLKSKFGEDLVREGLRLADAGVFFRKDRIMVDPGKGRFKDIGTASVSKTESKVEFDPESLSTRCLSCGPSAGGVCQHKLAVAVACNRQGFLTDDMIIRLIDTLHGPAKEGSRLSARICPNCKGPLDVASQIICPSCGHAVCPNCYRPGNRMCSRCYEVEFEGKRFMPVGFRAAAKDVLRPLARPAVGMLLAYAFVWLLFYSKPLKELHPLLPIFLIVAFLCLPLPAWAYVTWRRKSRT